MHKKLVLFSLLVALSMYVVFFFIHKPLNTNVKLANKCTTDLCIEAQNTLGIAPTQQATIYEMDQNRKDCAGCAYYVRNGLILKPVIEILPDALMSYGSQRFIALHEAAHVKYYHCRKQIILHLLFFLLLLLLLAIPLIVTVVLYKKFPKTLHLAFRLLFSIGLFYLLFTLCCHLVLRTHALSLSYRENYSKKCEQRADLTALKALNCSSCLKSAINYRKCCSKKTILEGGYMSLKEISKFKKACKTKQYCLYHSSFYHSAIDGLKRFIYC